VWLNAKRELDNTNVTFAVRDLTDFDHTAEPVAFDLITTFDAVHDQADPPALRFAVHRLTVGSLLISSS
jgi:hypothetical protein